MKSGVLLLAVLAAVSAVACAAPAEGVSGTEQGVESAKGAGAELTNGTKGTDETDEEVASSHPGFDEIRPILAETCGGCHRPTAFSTLEKVQALRPEMIRRLSSGLMPEDNPDWVNTPDGQKVLAYLRTSPELD